MGCLFSCFHKSQARILEPHSQSSPPAHLIPLRITEVPSPPHIRDESHFSTTEGQPLLVCPNTTHTALRDSTGPPISTPTRDHMQDTSETSVKSTSRGDNFKTGTISRERDQQPPNRTNAPMVRAAESVIGKFSNSTALSTDRTSSSLSQLLGSYSEVSSATTPDCDTNSRNIIQPRPSSDSLKISSTTPYVSTGSMPSVASHGSSQGGLGKESSPPLIEKRSTCLLRTPSNQLTSTVTDVKGKAKEKIKVSVYGRTAQYIHDCFEHLQTLTPLSRQNAETERRWDEFNNRFQAWKDCTILKNLVNHEFIIRAISDARVFLESMASSMSEVAFDGFDNRLIHDRIMMSQVAGNMIVSAEDNFWSLPNNDLLPVMDVLQMLVDGKHGEYAVLRKFLHKIVRKRNVLPSYLFLSGTCLLEQCALNGGGFADVYRGSYFGKPVAFKVLRIFVSSGFDLESVHKEFCKEAMIWRQFDHKNILPFHGVTKDHFLQRFAMVSPWMENGDLTSFLKHNSNANRLRMIAGVAEGLLYLHTFEFEVVHGDLRAGNVLVDEHHIPRISDFGLTRVIDPQSSTLLATSLKGKGSLRWQAPEILNPNQFEGMTDHVTTMSDVYAFGCLCLEVFTGEVPFSGLGDPAVILDVIHGLHPLRPSELATRRGLDDRVWNIMQSCWSTQPRDRPDSATIARSLSLIRRQH